MGVKYTCQLNILPNKHSSRDLKITHLGLSSIVAVFLSHYLASSLDSIQHIFFSDGMGLENDLCVHIRSMICS